MKHPFFHVMSWNHPSKTTIENLLFGVSKGFIKADHGVLENTPTFGVLFSCNCAVFDINLKPQNVSRSKAQRPMLWVSPKMHFDSTQMARSIITGSAGHFTLRDPGRDWSYSSHSSAIWAHISHALRVRMIGVTVFFHWRTGMNSCRNTCRIATKNHSFPDSCVYIHDKIGVKTVSDNAFITRSYPPKSGSTKIQKHLLKKFHVLCKTPGFHFELSVFSWCFCFFP